MEWLIAAGTTFAVIAPVELPDKTFVATLVLATRYRPLPVFLGVASAFAVHVTLAVLAGSLIALLPQQPVQLAATVGVATAAILLGRWIVRRVRLAVVRYLAAGVCTVLAVAVLVTAVP